ncbi:ATPase (AAA+ superfamily) [Candidatus Magnetomorum sp. HK-1]|nr:ATPase (AAA+ superfamily) [Candidatus Magnetomorum sp. HK-1]
MFIGRKNELNLLSQLIDSETSNIGVIYGRRRIGKSELIRKAFENKQVFIFEGLENRPKQEQIDSFIFQLSYMANQQFNSKKVTSWREAFILLYETLKNQPVHIVLDEFQWMANYRSEIVAELKMVWDLYISKIKSITLILCGSIASFMTTKVIKSNALYGRADLIIHLKGFLLSDTKKMLKNRGIDEIIDAQILLGGVPKYLDLIKDKTSIYRGLEELAFTETGYLTDEYDRIFVSHFGKNPEYERIIKTLAAKPYGLYRKQIAENAGVDLGGGLTLHLKNLEYAGFISSTTPFHKSFKSRLLKYRLSDAYLRFFFAFILPNMKRIKSGIQKSLFQQISQSSAFYNWMGRSFEYLCMDHAEKISELLGFSGIEFNFGPYFNSKTTDNKGFQVDILFDRKDNVITLCEAKYSINPTGVDVIKEVEQKVLILEKQFHRKTIQKVLISKSGATKDLLATGYFYQIITPDMFF